MEGGLTTWQVLTVILIPLVGFGFVFLYSRISELWTAVNATRADLAAYKLEAERNFVRLVEIDKLEREIKERFDRIDLKLDKALGIAPVPQ